MLITRQTTPDLAKLVRPYTDEGAELLPDLCEATAHHDSSLNVTMRLANWVGRFQIDVGDCVPDYGTGSYAYH